MSQFSIGKEAIIDREGWMERIEQTSVSFSHSTSFVNPTILLPGFITYITQTLAQDFTKKIDRVSVDPYLLHQRCLITWDQTPCSSFSCAKVPPRGEFMLLARASMIHRCIRKLEKHVQQKSYERRRVVRRWTMKGTSFNFTFFPRQTDYLFHYAVVPSCTYLTFFRVRSKRFVSRGKIIWTTRTFLLREIFLEQIFDTFIYTQGMIIFFKDEEIKTEYLWCYQKRQKNNYIIII